MIFRIPILACFALAASPLQAAPVLNEGLLAELRSEAARKHPGVAAGEHNARAAAREVGAVRLWQDPGIGVGFMGAARRMRRADGDVMLGIEQELPKPGLYSAERHQQEALARAAVETTRQSANLAGSMAAKAAIELALADEALAIAENQIGWLREMVESARERAAAPDGSAADALRLEIELAREEALLAGGRRARKGYAEQLNLALGRAADSPWPGLKLPATSAPVPVTTAEIARISRANPKVRALLEKAAAAKSGVDIASRQRAPRVSVGVDTALDSHRGDVRETTVGLKLSLPWFNRSVYQAEVDSAKARELAATDEVNAAIRDLSVQVSAAVAAAASSAEQARIYGGEVLTKANRSAKVLEEAWTTSSATLTDVLDATRSLFAIRLEQRRLVASQLAALEDLQILVPH